jgi:amino acid permease
VRQTLPKVATIITMSSTESVGAKESTMQKVIAVQPATDIEAGSNEDGREELKRDLGSRHINMIAIAGMIVSSPNRITGVKD